MTSTLDRPARPPLDVPPAPAAVAGSTAAQAVGASLVAVLAPVVLAWVVDSDGHGTWLQAVRLALTLWLLAQHGGLVVDGGHVGLVPLGLTLAPAVACWFGGRRLSRLLDPRAEAIAAGATRSSPAWPPAAAIAAFVATYCLFVAAATLIADMPGAHPIGLQAVLGGAVLASGAGTLGAAAYRHGGVTAGLVRLVRTLPGPASRWVAPAVVALAVQVAASGVLLAGMVALGRGRVLALHDALGPGVAGGAVLTFAQVLLVPNLVIWTSAVIAGPGFAVGSGTFVDITSSRLGSLPAVPVLGALPGDGRLPVAALALLAVPFAAGALAGVLVARGHPASWKVAALHVAGAVLLAGAALAALAWLSGGPAGPGSLAVTGPPPLLTGAAFALEAGAGAALVVAGAWSWRLMRGGGHGVRRSRV